MDITVKNVCFGYNETNVLNDISLNIKSNDFVSILGPNGSGKSTLIKCISRILRIKQGEILIDGRNINSFEARELARTIGYVPQFTNNDNNSTIYEILELGRCPYVNWRLKNHDREVIENVIESFGLQSFVKKQFCQLSGGQQQRIKIARALVQEPEILLLDEPINNLDIRHQIDVLSLLGDIVKQKNITAVMAIHDLALAARYSFSVMLMSNGRIVDCGDPAKVISKDNVKDVYGVDVEIIKHKESLLLAL